MSYYSQLTFDEKQRLLEHAKARYVAGESLDQLAADLPVSKATLYRAQVVEGWRRKDLDAQAAGDAPLPKPDWLVKYESELARVPSGMDRAIVHAPDRLGQLKEQAESLPESLDITDMTQAAKKAGELAARYQLMGEVKLADAQARLAERFVRLALGMARVDGQAAGDVEDAEEDAPKKPSLEELRAVIKERLRRMPLAGPGNEGRTMGDLDDEEEERARVEAARAEESLDAQDIDVGDDGDGAVEADATPLNSSAEAWEAALEEGSQSGCRIRLL